MCREADLIARITALEVAVGRLQNAMRGQLEAIQFASQCPVECALCGDDITVKTECDDPDCPCYA